MFDKPTIYSKLEDAEFTKKIILNKNLIKFQPNKNRLLAAKEIQPEISAESTFSRQQTPSQNMSYAEYFQDKYKIEVANKTQPMVEVCHVECYLHFLIKPIELKKENVEKKRKYKELFIAEHLTVLPFTMNQAVSFFMLPAIFHRLNCFLKALKLKAQIEMQIIKDLKITNVIILRQLLYPHFLYTDK